MAVNKTTSCIGSKANSIGHKLKGQQTRISNRCYICQRSLQLLMSMGQLLLPLPRRRVGWLLWWRILVVGVAILWNPERATGMASTSTALQNTKNNNNNWVVVSTKSNGGHSRRFYVNDGNDVAHPDFSPLGSPRINGSLLQTQAQLQNQSNASQSSSLHAFWLRFQNRFVAKDDASRSIIPGENPWRALKSRIVSSLRSTFLPVGYPYSVPSGYLSFSVWSWIQDLSTSLRGVLATQRVLQGIGVGRSTATAVSAVQNFLVRDAAGMAATLLFTSAAAGRFSNDSKRWRLFADLMVDVGISLEVAAVQMPSSFFLPMLCLGNMCKAVCGVAAGATGGSIAVFWASNNNISGSGRRGGENNDSGSITSAGTDISDINAKSGAQHTVMASIGLVFAAFLTNSVASASFVKVWTLYLALTALHIYANVQCMRQIAFSYMNTPRMDLVVDAFLHQWIGSSSSSSSMMTFSSNNPTATTGIVLPTPHEIAAIEPLFFISSWGQPIRPKASSDRVPIHLGVSFNDFVQRSGQNPLDLLTRTKVIASTTQVPPSTASSNSLEPRESPRMIQQYWIGTGTGSTAPSTPRNDDTNHQFIRENSISVAWTNEASSIVKARAYFHAVLLRRTLDEVHKTIQRNESTAKPLAARKFGSGRQRRCLSTTEIQVAESLANDELPRAWKAFCLGCEQAGWDLSRTELQNQGYEIIVVSSQG